MTNVFDYFTDKLGYEPKDETFKELPVESKCGDDCRKAIDAAFEFLKSSRAADGDMRTSEIVDHCEHTCCIFWHG